MRPPSPRSGGAASPIRSASSTGRTTSLFFLENSHGEGPWRERLDNPRFVTRIAETDVGAAVAYSGIGPMHLPFDAPRPAIELRQLYVLQPWHGQGVAAALMEWTLAEARRRGAQDLYLSVFLHNPRARRFYERSGFDYVGNYKFMVGQQADDELIMRRPLDV